VALDQGRLSGRPFPLVVTMASAAVEEIVEGYLRDNFTTVPIFPENSEGETPNDGSAFILIQFPMSDVRRVTLSDPCFEETGYVRISVNVARGDGTTTIRQYGTELAALLRETKIGQLKFGVPSEPFTDDTSDEGMYFKGSMLVPFTFYFRGD
jgi:hypothetical protein